MKVTSEPIDKVTPYWRNPRKNDAAIEAVAASIRAYGFNSPIVIDSDRVIVAGHTRYAAARALGMKSVPCVTVPLDAQQASAYRIADNKTSELSTWDETLLIAELRTLADLSVMEPFFSAEELAGAMGTLRLDDSPTDADIATASDALVRPMEARPPSTLDAICPDCGYSFTITDGRIAPDTA